MRIAHGPIRTASNGNRRETERRDQRVFGRPGGILRLVSNYLRPGALECAARFRANRRSCLYGDAVLVSDDEETGLVFGTSRRVDISV